MHCNQLPNTKTRPADIMLLATIAVSVLISSVAVSRLLSEQGSYMSAEQSSGSLTAGQGNSASDQAPQGSNEVPADDNDMRAGELEGSGSAPDAFAGAPPVAPALEGQQQAPLVTTLYSPIYQSSPYLLPFAYGAVAAALIWRGKIRSAWCKMGYDYETFRLVARMKGSPVRVKLLASLSSQKNRLQLANELDVDWKTIDNHIDILTNNGLIEEKSIVGTTRYYGLSEHGRRVLALLTEGGMTKEDRVPNSFTKQELA